MKSSFVYHKIKIKIMINNGSRYSFWRATSSPAAEVASVILSLLHEKRVLLRKVSDFFMQKKRNETKFVSFNSDYRISLLVSSRSAFIPVRLSSA